MTGAVTSDKITFLPKDVDDVTMHFGGIKGLMPPRESVPDRFTWGDRLFNDWFYRGLKSIELTPKDGIDRDKAVRHIRTIMGSFEPKHEHKEAACAYLFELWFQPGKWEPKEWKP